MARKRGARASIFTPMVPLIPLRPQTTPTSDPPASRRATLILNLAFAALAVIIVLSNLLFFPFGFGGKQQTAAVPGDRAPPGASAPVIIELPSPKPPDTEPSPEPDTEEQGTSVLPQIEPAAPPPDAVASLPPAGDAAPETPATPQASPAQAPPQEATAPTLSADEVEAFTRRGDALLGTGDIIAARLVYERAARAGSAAAATGVGKTFDPLFLAAAGVRGIQGNPFEAAAWYRRGSAAGDSEAGTRLQALRRQFPQ